MAPKKGSVPLQNGLATTLHVMYMYYDHNNYRDDNLCPCPPVTEDKRANARQVTLVCSISG